MTAPTQSAADHREQRLDRLRVLLGVIAVVLLAILTWSVFSSRDVAEEAVTQTQDLAQQVQAACESGGAAAAELEAIGACDQADQAARGATIADAPPPSVVEVATDAQVRTAVTDYLEEHPPAPGRPATQAEVDAAVARYCDANACRGSDGAPGEAGSDGADGQNATDDQVRVAVADFCNANDQCRPSQEQVNTAVALYCQQNPGACVGPAGEQGAEGPPGPQLQVYYVTDELGFTKRCTLQPSEPEDDKSVARYKCTRM